MAKKIKRELECKLSAEEKSTLAIKASEDRHKARELKEQAKELDTAAKEAEDQVAKGLIKRQVECVEDRNFSTNEYRIVRNDDPKYWPDETTAVVETRPLTGDERQTLIDTGGDDDSEKPAKVTTKAPKGRGKKNAAPN